jgi:hypothetical protein
MGHHYLPQRYLANFQDPERPGFIWIHDKRGGPARPAAIKKVAQVRQFYSEEMERFLANEVELPGNNVIRKLTNSEAISPAERLELAFYIGTMLRRVPSHRRWAASLVPDALAETMRNVRGEIRAIVDEGRADPEQVARRLREIDQIEQRYQRELPREIVEQINNPLPSGVVTGVLYEMTWRVLVSPREQNFITTDNPVFYTRWEGYGLGNAQSEFCFPLSTTHALHGSRQRARSNLVYPKVRLQIIKEINRRLVSQTDRLAFYHRPAPWLFPILTKPELQLSLIGW